MQGTFPPSPARNARVSAAPGWGSALHLSRPPSLHPVGVGERRGRSSRSGFRGGAPSRAAAPALTIQGLPPWTADPGGTAWSSTALLGHPGLGATPSPAGLLLRPHLPQAVKKPVCALRPRPELRAREAFAVDVTGEAELDTGHRDTDRGHGGGGYRMRTGLFCIKLSQRYGGVWQDPGRPRVWGKLGPAWGHSGDSAASCVQGP